MSGVLVLLLAILAIIFRNDGWKRSRWRELLAQFPAPENLPDVKLFKRCGGQAGRVSFTNRQRGTLTLGFSPDGIIVKATSTKFQNLLVPWEKIRSASKYKFGSKDVAKVEIKSDVPFNLLLSGEALAVFEAWHRVETKTLQQFLDER